MLALLLAVTMLPAAALLPAFADEPAAGAEVTDGGLVYKVADGAATLVGFEDSAALEGALVVPETVGDGAIVKAVEIAEGQVADEVTSLAMPQTVEAIKTEGLAAAFPALAAIEVASNGAYSSVAGMLFRSAAGQSSSDGTAFADDALELVWAPPAMVVARIPLECKAIAAGAFVDASALETVMSFGKMESIAAAERDEDGNVTKPGAFTDEQVGRLTIVVPGTNYAVTGEGAERVSGSVALSEKTDMLEKRKTWFHYGFFTDQIIMGAPFGEIEGVIGVDDEGVAEDRSLITPLQNGKGHLELTREEQAEVDARKAAEPKDGLSFSYQASMDLSVRWAGDRTATPAHIDVPAYAKVDGVTYQVTQIEPGAFEGAVFLASVTIPEGVTSIGESAFAGCTNLKEVSLLSTLKTIDYAAFKGTALESVDIPDSVRWIGGEAFDEGCEVSRPITSEAASEAPGGRADASVGEEIDSIEAFAGFGGGQSMLPAGSIDFDYYTTFTEDLGNSFWILGGRTPIDEGSVYRCTQRYTRNPVEHGLAIGASAAQVFSKYPLSEWSLENGAWIDGVSYRDIVRPDMVKFSVEVTDTGVLLTFSYTGDAERAAYRFVPYEITDSRPGLSITGMWLGSTVAGYKWYPKNTPVVGTGGVADGEFVACKLTLGSSFFDVRASAEASSSGQPISFVAGSFDPANVSYAAGSGGSKSSLTVAAAATKAQGFKVYAKRVGNDLKFFSTAEATGDPAFTLTAKADTGYHVDWKLDGTSLADGGAAVAVDYTSTHSIVADYLPNDYSLTLLPGVAAWTDGGGRSKTIHYKTGETVALDKTAHFNGFWLKGWVWDTPESSTVHSGLADPTQPTFEVPTGAYGNATLHAVWTPKRYVVDYDVAKAGSAFDAAPASGEFISETAVSYVDDTRYSADAGSPMMAEWDRGYRDQPGFQQSKDNAVWIDTAGISDEFAHARDLAGKTADPATGDLAIPGYDFRGWTTAAGHNFDNPSLPPELAYDLAKDGRLPMSKVFEATWNSSSHNLVPAAGDTSNHATLYGVWTHRSLPEDGITLGSNGAPDKNNEAKAVCDIDGKSVAAGTTKIYYWQGRGLVSEAERAVIYTDSPHRKVAGAIDEGMGLVAPVRYGFEFLGWGVPTAADKPANSEDVIYISYDEGAARDASDSGKVVPGRGFALTEAGAALMEGDPANLDNVAWQAVWAIRTVEVTFRIPSYAVDEADVEGWSTRPGHDVTQDGATKYEYDDYAWYEGTAEETGQGANASWYIAKRSWKYFDLLEHPAFKTQRDRYTYDGWYDLMKPSMTDSTDKALEDLGDDVARVATFEDMRSKRVYATGDGEATDVAAGGLSIGETYFTVGDPNAQSAGSKTLWLWASPIRINVASPVGVYLCTTNSYGQAVEPFVVGNDRRTQLEAQATFQVATNSHDLQLVGVTAEDVTAFDYQRDDAGNVVKDGDIPVVDAGTVESGEANAGMADRILNPLYTDAATDRGEKYTYSDETSRMFWVSPVPTATADQTGVVYKGDATAQSEAAKVPGASPTFGDNEGDLKPDVETRRYFGFGYRPGEGAEPDNRIEDSLPSASDGEEQTLEGFVLRRHDNYASDKNGLALVKYDAASDTSTYRFYYGLDMRRAEFDLAELQKIIDNNAEIDYNSAFDQPLLRVKFTFAAARNPGISYFSARGGDEAGAGEAAGGKIPEETVITVGSAS